MSNPWIAATVISVTVGFCFFLYNVFTNNLLEERPAIRSRPNHSNSCEICGLSAGQHKDGCALKPPSPTQYRVYRERQGFRTSCPICQTEILKDECCARLPCLCTFHKKCIDRWFLEKKSCPVHPSFGRRSIQN